MKLKITNLPLQFENIVIELRLYKVKALFKEFRVTSVYFLTKRWYIKKLTVEKLYLNTIIKN